jgi:alkylation response protein AidB-like acyl-CoA dehydrogenase
MQTRAVKDGNENYILNGEKWFSSSASVADMALVMAMTDPDAPRHKRYSTFIVELPNPGYNIKRNIKNMAIEGPYYDEIHGGHSEIEIKDLKVSADNLVGGEGNGFNMGQHRLAYGRLRHGMHNIAKAQRALDMATAHVTKRSTFGQLLADRQAVQFMLAECATQLYIGRLMLMHIAYKAGELDRKGLSRPHGPPRDRHRDPASRRARLFPGYAARAMVHPGALAAPGRRPRRGPPLEGRPQRHQGVPRARDDSVGGGRRFAVDGHSSFRGGATRRTRNPANVERVVPQSRDSGSTRVARRPE